MSSAYENSLHRHRSAYVERTQRMPNVPLTYISVCKRMRTLLQTFMSYAVVCLHFKGMPSLARVSVFGVSQSESITRDFVTAKNVGLIYQRQNRLGTLRAVSTP